MSDKIPEPVKLLWDLGNLVAGFAAAQGIAFGFMTLQKEWIEKILNHYPIVIEIINALIIFGIVLQIWAVLWCHRASLDAQLWSPPKHIRNLFVKVMWGRLVCVILFGMACLMAAWGPISDNLIH